MVVINVPVMVEYFESNGELELNDAIYIILDGKEVEIDGDFEFPEADHHHVEVGKTYIGVQSVELEDDWCEFETNVSGKHIAAQWNGSPEEFPEVEIESVSFSEIDITEYVDWDASDTDSIEQSAVDDAESSAEDAAVDAYIDAMEEREYDYDY